MTQVEDTGAPEWPALGLCWVEAVWLIRAHNCCCFPRYNTCCSLYKVLVDRRVCLPGLCVCLWSPQSLPVQLSLPSSQVSGVATRAEGHPPPRDTYFAFSRVGISVGRPHSGVHVGCPCLVIFHRALPMCGGEGGFRRKPHILGN